MIENPQVGEYVEILLHCVLARIDKIIDENWVEVIVVQGDHIGQSFQFPRRFLSRIDVLTILAMIEE